MNKFYTSCTADVRKKDKIISIIVLRLLAGSIVILFLPREAAMLARS